MLDFLFEGNALWFGIPALVGTGVFALQFVMSIIGADADGDFDGGFDGDFDFDADFGGDADVGGHESSTHVFKVLSLQSIGAFLMGFGWTGLAAMKGSDLSFGTSAIIGLAVGAGLMWLLVFLLTQAHKLRASGNIPLSHTLGVEGTVYVMVPGGRAGRGQVRVVVDGRQRLYRAVTEGPELVRDTPIKVVKVNTDNTVTIARA